MPMWKITLKAVSSYLFENGQWPPSAQVDDKVRAKAAAYLLLTLALVANMFEMRWSLLLYVQMAP